MVRALIPFSLSILSLLCFCALVFTEKAGEFAGAADIFCEANHVTSVGGILTVAMMTSNVTSRMMMSASRAILQPIPVH